MIRMAAQTPEHERPAGDRAAAMRRGPAVDGCACGGAVTVAGVLLAAGAGRRMGGPKALLQHADGVTWVARAAQVLRDGGCDPVLVVVGAQAAAARTAVTTAGVDGISVVHAQQWAEGMGASLRAGLEALEQSAAEAVVVALVDMPGVTAEVVRRLVARAVAGPEVLARASYAGTPGHPVLIGRGHWLGVRAVATGDAGARAYLQGRPVTLVECSDLASGDDRDTPV